MIEPSTLRAIADKNETAKWYCEINDAVCELREAADEIERLQKIVDAFPKDADGDVMNPFQRYWWHKHGEIHTGYLTVMEDCLTPSSWAPTAPGAYHKTREAAEEAAKKAVDTSSGLS